ncbi:class I fructose-bisphosphate aldolase [Desulfobacterium sp. N47]|uniref:fructose-bisphosphate aldolase n=1 Tax=uncultured Desulfobacterium sp. TaxID=201089 RepID=E1YMH6_9BACT|nr:hypothetical protein N47_N25950 [uncultured Desulfobacterium sp.]
MSRKVISGAILYDETIRQQKKDVTTFIKVITDAGIIPGIKVDTGAKDMAGHPGEKITEGPDGLCDCHGRWRFRLPAPSSNRLWRFGSYSQELCME